MRKRCHFENCIYLFIKQKGILLSSQHNLRLHDLINEIHELSRNTPRKAAFDIYNILENNKLLFADCMDADVFRQLLNAFEKMAYANAGEFNSPHYKEDFMKAYNLLSFYLGKVI